MLYKQINPDNWAVWPKLCQCQHTVLRSKEMCGNWIVHVSAVKCCRLLCIQQFQVVRSNAFRRGSCIFEALVNDVCALCFRLLAGTLELLCPPSCDFPSSNQVWFARRKDTGHRSIYAEINALIWTYFYMYMLMNSAPILHHLCIRWLSEKYEVPR